MDRGQIVVLLLIIVTYLLWRRARRARRLAELEAALADPVWSYGLAAFETAGGRGYVLTQPDGGALDNDALDWEEHGVAIVPLERDSSQVTRSLPPGTAVTVEAEPGSWTREQRPASSADVAVRARDGGELVGAIGGADAAPVGEWLERGLIGDCIVLFESRGAAGVGTWLLLVHRDASVEG